MGRYSPVNSHNSGISPCLIGNSSNSMALASIAICVIGDLSLADWRKKGQGACSAWNLDEFRHLGVSENRKPIGKWWFNGI